VSLRCCALLAISIACPLAAKTFEEKVLPILKANCTPCHDDASRTSGFSIQTPGAVMTGGNRRGAAGKAGLPSESPLVQMLRGQLKPQMPLGKTLPEADIAVIEKWIRELRPEDGIVQATVKNIGRSSNRSGPIHRRFTIAPGSAILSTILS